MWNDRRDDIGIVSNFLEDNRNNEEIILSSNHQRYYKKLILKSLFKNLQKIIPKISTTIYNKNI